MDEKIINEIYGAVKHDMKSGNVIWEDLIGSGFRYVTAIRAAISAHAAFLDALNKIALFANQSKGGCEDLGKLLCRLVDEEKNIDMMRASAVTHLNDGVLAPLEERVTEWRKMAQSEQQSNGSTNGTPKRNLSESMKNLRKGSSSENLFNRAAMTLSRRSRRGSSSRDRTPKELQPQAIEITPVSKEGLKNILVENRARITTFIKALHPYYNAEIEHGRLTAGLAEEGKNMMTLSHIKNSQISNWVEEQLLMYRDTPPEQFHQLARHNRKSSVSSVNSVSSSKSDSCSSGSMKITEPPIYEQGSRQSLLRTTNDMTNYRLSSTSHDSGFTSHAHENETSQEQDFSKNRTPSWKDWPKPGPYEAHRSQSMQTPRVNNNTNDEVDFELPPPPPELLNGGFDRLEIITNEENCNTPQMQSPSRSNSSMSSVPLSPFMKQKPSPLAGPNFIDDYSPTPRATHFANYGAIENGLATIRRKPSQNPSLRRSHGPTSVPVPPVPPTICYGSNSRKPPPVPVKPKRVGSVLSSEHSHQFC